MSESLFALMIYFLLAVFLAGVGFGIRKNALEKIGPAIENGGFWSFAKTRIGLFYLLIGLILAAAFLAVSLLVTKQYEYKDLGIIFILIGYLPFCKVHFASGGILLFGKTIHRSQIKDINIFKNKGKILLTVFYRQSGINKSLRFTLAPEKSDHIKTWQSKIHSKKTGQNFF